jgi:hypothetical protein
MISRCRARTTHPGSPPSDGTGYGACRTGDLVTWQGDYFRFNSARIWDLPDTGVPIAVAVSGDKSIGQTPIFWGPDKDAAAVEVGDENQQRFIDEAAGPLLEKLGADCSRTGDSG